jgi:hypothetical protein
MKQLVCLLLLASFIACNNKENSKASNPIMELATDSLVVEPTMPVYDRESKLYVWKSAFDYTKKHNQQFNSNILNADSLIKGLNELNEKIVLEKIKISGDTIYTIIKDSKYLTDGIGTTGAEVYLADVVLNLTEVPGIKYVNIDLEEGSHMQPGTWNKENFVKYKTIQ